MKTRVRQSTEISGLEVGQKVAKLKMLFLTTWRELLRKGAVQLKADLAHGDMGVQEKKRGQGVALTRRVHQIQQGVRERGKACVKKAGQ